MVSRASAVGCHPLREVPSLRRRRSISLKRQVLRTRRPTGLDAATLTGSRFGVKRHLARPRVISRTGLSSLVLPRKSYYLVRVAPPAHAGETAAPLLHAN